MANKIGGNTAGLKASELRAAEALFRRRGGAHTVVTPELASALCRFSHETGRQIGALIGRRGQPEHIIVGDAARLWLPDVGRLRAGRGRLRGLRLVHTHLDGEGLSNDDLTDLALLRLDLVAAITITHDGLPDRIYCAHVLPEDSPTAWAFVPAARFHDLDLDPLALVQSLEDEFARASRVLDADPGSERAILVHLALRRGERGPEGSVAELKELCRTAGVSVKDIFVQRRDRPDPKYVVGRGKLDEVVLRANQLGAEMLIFDPDLTPAQTRAISDATELKVLDRSMLILDIFAQHAKSRDGKLQVELAQLRYTLPRLVAKNTMMSRLAGGIGGRGPGETKLEINRRRARDRIARLERELSKVAEQRERRRALRKRRGLPVVSIVGYTNAGKSTLLNAMTQGEALAENKLFATLNPTSRRLRFPKERELIINDTVGFIHDLPAELVAAFRATLEEISETDLLIHLVDLASADFREQIAAVERILNDLGLSAAPTLLVFNKTDLLTEDEILARKKSFNGVLSLSAQDKGSTQPLLEEIEKRLWAEGKEIRGF